MRPLIPIAAALCLLLAGCPRRSPAELVLWRGVLERQGEASASPASLEAKQQYVDALANFLRVYPDDAEALALYEKEELDYARALARRGRHSDAIPYYESILARNPAHAEARAELVLAQSQASTPKERFAGLRRGMTADEVTTLLGAPRPGWTHTLEKGTTKYETWYYRRTDGGTASVGFADGRAYVAEYDGVLRLDP